MVDPNNVKSAEDSQPSEEKFEGRNDESLREEAIKRNLVAGRLVGAINGPLMAYPAYEGIVNGNWEIGALALVPPVVTYGLSQASGAYYGLKKNLYMATQSGGMKAAKYATLGALAGGVLGLAGGNTVNEMVELQPWVENGIEFGTTALGSLLGYPAGLLGITNNNEKTGPDIKESMRVNRNQYLLAGALSLALTALGSIGVNYMFGGDGSSPQASTQIEIPVESSQLSSLEKNLTQYGANLS